MENRNKREVHSRLSADARCKPSPRLISFLLVFFLFCGAETRIAFAVDYFSEGVSAANKGDMGHAIAMFTKAIQRDPSSYAAHVNRGSVLFKSGLVFRGIVDWRRARDLAPSFAFAVFTGDMLQRSTRKNSLLNYVLSTELDPEYVASVAMAGATYLDLGQPELARVLFRKSMDLTRNPFWKSHFEYWADSLDNVP